jgi:hypothetical protein
MRHVTLTALLALALAACGDKAEDAVAPTAATPEAGTAPTATATDVATASAEPELPPLPTGDFRIVAVDLDRQVDAEGRVLETRSVFAPRDRIHAAVIGVGTSDGLTLSARLLGPDGGEQAKAGQSLAPTQPTVVSFQFTQPEPWPAGAYQLEVAINERVVETRDFEVR